jgi:PAS domain S-box-containing protein
MTPQGLRLMDIDDFAVVENADWVKIWKGADRDAAKAALDSARRGIDRRFQGFCPTVKGTPKWWDVIVMPINGASGKPERLLAVSRDISDARCKRNELRETNHFLDSLFEALPLMVYVKDARTLRYIRINRECERITGFKRRATIELTARDILPPAEAAAIEITDLETLTSGRLTEIQEEVVSTADRGPRSRHTMKMPIFDDSGAAQYLLGISEDVTERKLAEKAIQELNSALEAKARQLEISNKELESFSYSISHDLRAPLRAIDGFALMIEEDYREKLDTEGRRYVAVIRENSKRMGALIDDLLEFSRLGRLPVVSHDINVEQLVHEVVQEVLHEHGRHAAGGAAPHVEIGQLPPARGDRGLLRQVWTNLIANAIKYSSKKTHPRIEVSGGQTAAETHYSVRDNGVGFDMDYAGKLFGVFQRLHRADEFSGTGVGLAIVHRVVSRHGGRVWAEGKLGDGAVFSFALPRGGTDG